LGKKYSLCAGKFPENLHDPECGAVATRGRAKITRARGIISPVAMGNFTRGLQAHV